MRRFGSDDKKDLLDDTQFEAIRNIIVNKIRPNVKIVEASNGELATEILLGINAQAENDLESRHSHHEEDEANGLAHVHDDHIDSVVVDIHTAHTPESLITTLKDLIEEHEIYRIKGFINMKINLCAWYYRVFLTASNITLIVNGKTVNPVKQAL